MRMRERPWTSIVAREVALEPHRSLDGGVDAFCYNAHHKSIQPPRLKSRGQHLCGRSRGHYRTSNFKTVHSSQLDLASLTSNTTSNQTLNLTNPAVKTCWFMPLRTFSNNCLSEPPGLGRPSSSSCQDLHNLITSLPIDRNLSDQSFPPFPPRCGMTKNASTPGATSSCPNGNNNNNLNTGTKNTNNTNFSTTNNFIADVNNSNGQWSLRKSRSSNSITKKVSINSRGNDVVKCGIKNSYRNLDETKFDLSSDRRKGEVSSGVSFAALGDEIKSPDNSRLTFAEVTPPKMSASDLPPITSSAAPKGDKRKTSFNSAASTGINASTSQPATSFSSKTSYSRRSSTATADSWADAAIKMAEDRLKMGRFSTYRNLNDFSNPNLRAKGSNLNNESSSAHSSPTSQRKAPGRNRSKNGGNSEMKSLTNNHRLLSWSTTDLLQPQETLEPLFESKINRTDTIPNSALKSSRNINITRQDNNRLSDKHHNNQSGVSIKKTTRNRIITANNNNSNEMPSIARFSRSISVNKIKNNERIRQSKNPNKKITNGIWDNAEVRNGDAFKYRRGITRSSSENKLNGKLTNDDNGNTTNVANRQDEAKMRSFSRNMSVDRIQRPGSNYHKLYRGIPSSQVQPGSDLRLMRCESLSNLQYRDQRQALIDVSNQGDEQHPELDNVKVKARLVEWLCVVNNVEKYEIDPRHEVADYTDEPPQTDTAIHLVYEGE